MDKELKNLKQISDFFKRTSAKIKLIKLITKAKSEYDKYDFTSSQQSLEEAYKLDNKNATILRGLGCLCQFEKKFDKAINYYTEALKYSQNKEIEYTLIGMVYYLQNKLDEAVKNFNMAIDENDDYDEAYEGRNQAMLENHLKILDLHRWCRER